MEKQKLDFLTAKARKLRDDAIEIIGHFGVGHIGGTMSVMDALTVIYYAKANVDPKIRKSGQGQSDYVKGTRRACDVRGACRFGIFPERVAAHAQRARHKSSFSLRYDQDSRHRHDGRLAGARFVGGRGYGSCGKDGWQSCDNLLLYR